MLKQGDEVFVCPQMHRQNPLRWELVTIEKVTQRFFYLDFSPLSGKRLRLEAMCSSDGFYQVFVPTPEERQAREEAYQRSKLISVLVRADWGALATPTLQRLVHSVEQENSQKERSL